MRNFGVQGVDGIGKAGEWACVKGKPGDLLWGCGFSLVQQSSNLSATQDAAKENIATQNGLTSFCPK